MKELTWQIHFYSGRVARDMDKPPAGILPDFNDLLDQVEVYGPDLGEPHTKSMGRGLYEF